MSSVTLRKQFPGGSNEAGQVLWVTSYGFPLHGSGIHQHQCFLHDVYHFGVFHYPQASGDGCRFLPTGAKRRRSDPRLWPSLFTPIQCVPNNSFVDER